MLHFFSSCSIFLDLFPCFCSTIFVSIEKKTHSKLFSLIVEDFMNEYFNYLLTCLLSWISQESSQNWFCQQIVFNIKSLFI